MLPFPSRLMLENVRCLECSEVYAKPVSGGVLDQNPGCPSCGYSGWIPVSLPSERERRLRSAAGRPRLRRVPTH